MKAAKAKPKPKPKSKPTPAKGLPKKRVQVGGDCSGPDIPSTLTFDVSQNSPPVGMPVSNVLATSLCGVRSEVPFAPVGLTPIRNDITVFGGNGTFGLPPLSAQTGGAARRKVATNNKKKTKK